MARELIRRFGDMMQVDILAEEADGTLHAYFDNTDGSPLVRDQAFRETLRCEAAKAEKIYVFRDEADAFYMAEPYRRSWVFIGPVFCGMPDRRVLKNYYEHHLVAPEDMPNPTPFTMRQIKDIFVLAGTMLTGSTVNEDDFRVRNPSPVLNRHEVERELSQNRYDDETQREAGDYKHSYRDEQILLQAVREGRSKDVIRISEKLDDDTGRFSSKNLVQWQTKAVIGLTLVSRAAIDAGIPPETAYRVSGYYISCCIGTPDVGTVILYRNRGLEDLTERVKQLVNKTHGSAYTNQCKDYICKHYREKIYIEDIAAPLGISAGYLARIFKKETGYSIQQYITLERVDRAANLLVFSETSISNIAEYVNFPSQSYLGKVFKEIKGVTPYAYRRQNAAPEFHQKSAE
ncbi:MAG: AraC family transcriptional regulator [Eubacterium sp.]|nr:AraC family transcriptional regulator [Eubacterium sp.]